jgi:hypothetical protein
VEFFLVNSELEGCTAIVYISGFSVACFILILLACVGMLKALVPLPIADSSLSVGFEDKVVKHVKGLIFTSFWRFYEKSVAR